MGHIKQLNTDILTQIVKYIDIDNVEITCRCLMRSISKAEIDSIIHHRQSPIVLLKRLVDDPELLLLAMGFTGVLLSGSQATEYFYPGIISESSDWDFYCPPNPLLASVFQNFLETIGVKWMHKADENTHSISNADIVDYGLHTTTGRIDNGTTIQTIQLIRDHITYCQPFEVIVKFHSSIVQCFISSFGAVCMHRNLTMKGRSIAWRSKGNACKSTAMNEKDKIDSEIARSKYISRGIKYTSYEWYTNVCQNTENHYISTAIINTRLRKVGDNNSKVIPFTHYYSKDVNKLDILYSRSENELSIFNNLHWLEDPYECTRSMRIYTLQFSNIVSPITLTKLCCLHPKLATVLESRQSTEAVPETIASLFSMTGTLF